MKWILRIKYPVKCTLKTCIYIWTRSLQWVNTECPLGVKVWSLTPGSIKLQDRRRRSKRGRELLLILLMVIKDLCNSFCRHAVRTWLAIFNERRITQNSSVLGPHQNKALSLLVGPWRGDRIACHPPCCRDARCGGVESAGERWIPAMTLAEHPADDGCDGGGEWMHPRRSSRRDH